MKFVHFVLGTYARFGRKEWEAEPKSYFATNAADKEWQKGIPRIYAVSAIRLVSIIFYGDFKPQELCFPIITQCILMQRTFAP